MSTWIVITGTPSDGFIYYGPFKSKGDAIEYAENENFHESWWIDTLELP